MTKHTRGPWFIERVDPEAFFTSIGETVAIVGTDACGEANGYTIGRHCDYGPHGAEQTTKNALLIAAAPDMLDALEDLVYQVKECARMGLGNEGLDAIDTEQAKSALKKAKGEN